MRGVYCPATARTFSSNSGHNRQLEHQRARGREREVSHRDREEDQYDHYNRSFSNYMDHMVNDFFGVHGAHPFRGFRKMIQDTDMAPQYKELQSWRPTTHTEVTAEGTVVVTAEMPGLAKEDVSIEVHNGVLTIRGEKKTETKSGGSEGEGEGSSTPTHSSTSYMTKSFVRRFNVPEGLDVSKVKAKMEHGILKVTIPQTRQEPKGTSISIE